MRASTALTINRRFGSLVVKRINDDGTCFCLCACGSQRTVLRAQLTSQSITKCRACANASRQKPNPQVPYEPPEKLVKIEIPKCSSLCAKRVIDSVLYESHQPDCPRIGVFKVVEVQR